MSSINSQLSANQLATLRLCAEEECSVVELLQEVKSPEFDRVQLREVISAALSELGREHQVEFFLDVFSSSSVQEISLDEAQKRLSEDATWDMHNPTQLHVRWSEG